MKKQFDFATWLRAFGVVCILLCHFVVHSNNPYVVMSAQLFNIGVSIFIMLSGFLFGIQMADGIDSVYEWYKKRLKRIYIPYELFIMVLAVIWLTKGMNIITADWLLLIFGMQGTAVGVLGANQTWFITPLLICYLITPLLSKLGEWGCKRKVRLFSIVIITAAAPFAMAFVPPAFVSSLLSPVAWYIIAFFVGMRFDQRNIEAKRAMVAFFIMMLAFAVRISARFLFDGTIWYDRIVVNYTHVIAAFCIFYMFAYIFGNVKPIKPVAFVSKISFEIYLYHYMFCEGPISLFGITPYWITDCMLVTLAAITIATITNLLVNRLTKSRRKANP